MFLRTLQRCTEPGGLLLVIDTLRDAGQAVGADLGNGSLSSRDAAAISDTFARSHSLAEFGALASSALPGSDVAPLEFDDEVLIDAELSMPETFPEDLALDAPIVVLATIRWRHPPAAPAPSRPARLAGRQPPQPQPQPTTGGERT